MKLSELIKKLEELQEKCYGDPVYFSATGGNAGAIQKMSEMRENIKNGRI